MPIDVSITPEGSRHVVAAGLEPDEEQQADHGHGHTDERHLARADRRDEPLGEARADDDPRREREEREPCLERGVAEHALEVERVEEEHREQP
jgi:hypothetical protein